MGKYDELLDNIMDDAYLNAVWVLGVHMVTLERLLNILEKNLIESERDSKSEHEL